MDQQIQQAVEIALSGTADLNLKNQAYEFINQIKSTEEGYKSCLDILMKSTSSISSINEGLKFFIFQVIDENMSKLNNEQLLNLNSNLFEYLKTLIAHNQVDQPYLKNKLAGLFGNLFCHVYLSVYPSFLKELLNLIQSFTNTLSLEYYTRVLIAIHYEIGDKFISRSREIQERNNLLKDAIRVNDMNQLVASWSKILQQQPLNGIINDDILNNTLKIIGLYIGWMEINLFISNDFLNSIFQYLKIDNEKNQTCLTLIELISKKMKPSNKLELITLLDLTNVITTIEDDDIEFIENLSKLTNQIGLELIIVLESEPNFLNDINQQFLKLWPLILEFLNHEYDDVSQQVFSFIQQYLLICKKFTQLISFDLFSTLLNKIIIKMKFDEDDNGLEVDEQFNEIRSKLKTFQDTIAILIPNLYIETLPMIIEQSIFQTLNDNDTTTNNNNNNDSTSKIWITIELGLFQLNNYGDSLKNNNINVPKQEIYTSKPYQIFQDFLVRLINNSSQILSINHPKIQLSYFEIIVRHYSLKLISNDLTLKILESFSSQYGLFNQTELVRMRCWYLFSRFIKLTKPNIDGATLETLLMKIQPLLIIEAELPTKDEDDEIVEKGNFNNQLSLFESIGLLITIINNNDFTIKLIDLIFQPLFDNLQTCISRDDKLINPIIPLQAHHSLMALATIVRGFECEYSPELVLKINNASQVVLFTLESFNKFEIVREASRFSFARFIPILKDESNNHLSKLISLILATPNLKINELSDFLSFIGQITHQFKNNDNIYQLLNSLLTPLINKIYDCLNISDEYPDLIRDKYNLKKSYMNFVSSIILNNQTSLLITETNKQIFPRVLTSFVDYAYDITEPSISKLAIVQLANIINIIGGNNGKLNDPNDKYSENLSPIDGIDQFLMDATVKLTFELPFSKAEFDLKDAQYKNLSQELSLLLKAYQTHQQDQEFLLFLANYLNNMGMDQQKLNDLGSNLVKLDQKTFKKYYTNFLTELKKAT